MSDMITNNESNIDNQVIFSDDYLNNETEERQPVLDHTNVDLKMDSFSTSSRASSHRKLSTINRSFSTIAKVHKNEVMFDTDEDYSENIGRQNKRYMRNRLIKSVSVMYALYIIMFGVIITIADIYNPYSELEHIYNTILTLIGLVWIVFIHWDIQKYKNWSIHCLVPDVKDGGNDRRKKSIRLMNQLDMDSVSVNTDIIFSTFNRPSRMCDQFNDSKLSAYRFSHGKHSTNFYLKCGLILFCMGSIIHQVVILSKQVHYFTTDTTECHNMFRLIFYLIRCLSSFYQLFIAFKYSNLLINRYKTIARFALMHLVGTSICFWFSTIIEETIEDYVLKVEHSINSTFNYSSIGDETPLKSVIVYHLYCSENALVNTDSMEALPYLYPFSIEYNIILASIWYIIWTNVGINDMSSQSHLIQPIMQENSLGEYEVNYKTANMVHVDCHASNLGLFSGLATLLVTLATMVLFFSTINQSKYQEIGVGIYNAQISMLILLGVIVIPLTYRKIVQLNISNHQISSNSSTSMNDFLLLLPLPFYIVHYVLSIIADAQSLSFQNVYLITFHFFNLLQISMQTLLIIDGTKRCANSKLLRFIKPGRGLITFLLILNITLWIINTFERKSVDRYHNMQYFYGKFNWMVITHTTLPLMLFYRFHSSVCLSDIWKHAYEKDEKTCKRKSKSLDCNDYIDKLNI